MKIAILHCGQAKTGTSSLQRFLAENAPVLAQHGILDPTLTMRKGAAPPLPWVGFQHSPGLMQLEAQGQKVAPNSDLGQITRQIDTVPHDVLILSAEYLFFNLFYAGANHPVTFLKDRGYRLESISYLRDQPDRLNSLYAQKCKTGQWQGGFDAFCAHRLRNSRHIPGEVLPIVARGLHNDRLAFPDLNPWGRHTFRPFSAEVKARGIEADFLETLREILSRNAVAPGLTKAVCDTFHPTARSNDRDGTILVALCRQIGKMVVRRTASQDRQSRQRQRGERAVYPAAVAALEALGIADPKFNGLTVARETSLRQVFANTNEIFARKVWGCSWAELFPPIPSDRLISNDLDESSDLLLAESYKEALPVARKELRKALDAIAETS